MPNDFPNLPRIISGEILETNSQERPRSEGEVRVRSNVCTDPNAWNLVPGDVLNRYGLTLRGITQKQHDEMMYYVPCCICKRTIFEILEDGCDYPVCRKQGTPSSVEAERRKLARLKGPEFL